MIKLKKILKEGLHGKFWWMDPNGKVIRVMKIDPQTGHHETAIQLLQAMGKQPEKDVFSQMYDLGWLRLSFIGNQGYYTLEFNTRYGKQPSNRQMSSLKDLAKDLDAFEILDGSTKQTYR